MTPLAPGTHLLWTSPSSFLKTESNSFSEYRNETVTSLEDDDVFQESNPLLETRTVAAILSLCCFITLVYGSHKIHMDALFLFFYRFRLFRSLLFVLRMVTKTVVGLLVLLVFFPPMLFLYLILFMIKKTCIKLVRDHFGNSVSEPFGMDVIWGTTSPVKNPIVNAVVHLEGTVDQEYVKKHLVNLVQHSRLKDGTNPFRKFKQTFETHYGYFIWKDDENFKIENHVRIVDLRDLYPGEMHDVIKDEMTSPSCCSDKLLCEFLNEYGAEGMPRHQPQWEVIFLVGENQNEFSMVFRLHHSIGDGIALMRLLLEVLSDTPTKISLLGPPLHPITRFFYAAWSITLIPYALRQVLFNGRPNPLHGKPLTGQKIYVTSKPIPLSIVKAIKKRTRATFTDILFSCLSSSLASFYGKRNYEIPDITIMFPIGFEDLSAPIALTNAFGMGLTELPTPSNREILNLAAAKDKPGEISLCTKRMHMVKTKLDSVKQDPTVLALFWVTSLAASVLPTFLCEALFTTKGKTMGVSNVPGPPNRIYVLKRKVLGIKFWVPDRAPTGTGFSILSYMDHITVSFSVDRAFINNENEAEKIIQDVISALYNFKDEVEKSEAKTTL